MTREEAIQHAEAHANEAQSFIDQGVDDDVVAHATVSLAFSALAHHLPPQVIQL